jgi:uncharacterized protein with von Willebrand factor type A (vWA) domain
VLRHLAAFAEELRAVGVPVSTVETMDAAAALGHVDLGDPRAVEAALAATLVKNAHHLDAFATAFEVYFGLKAGDGPVEEPLRTEEEARGLRSVAGGGGAGDEEAAALAAAIADALRRNDVDGLRGLVQRAVTRLSGIEPGRPVGGRYYFYRVMRRLGAERLAELLRGAPAEDVDEFEARLARDRAEVQLELLHTELRREIIRRLVADRGAADVARTLRAPLTEDLDLMHATRDELARVERAVGPLARKLATRLAHRRRHGRRGRLDVRRTIRRSLAHGGVLLGPRFRPPRRSKPELVLLCDVSGSMATFARFTMQLTYAVGSEFSKVRSFAFVDGIDEVTRFFGPGKDFHDALVAIGHEANVVWRDGHSDYGNALRRFAEEYADAVTPRTTVIVAGDARNNYRDPAIEVLAHLAREARAVFWLNPEAKRYWDTGDSVMGTYRPLCDGVYEARTLRQLERFVEEVALPSSAARRSAPYAS